jgi:hypothetical protein
VLGRGWSALGAGGGSRALTHMERMAVPHPTSSTTLSLKMCLFWTIAFMYDRVRTSSFYIKKGKKKKHVSFLHLFLLPLPSQVQRDHRGVASKMGFGRWWGEDSKRRGTKTHQHLLVNAFMRERTKPNGQQLVELTLATGASSNQGPSGLSG